MNNKLNALPKGSLILVTGANAYIGSNVIDCLLQLGFKVRGTVRTSKPWLDQMFRENYGDNAFKSIVIEDLGDESAINVAMEGIAGVIHIVRSSRYVCENSGCRAKVI